MNEHLGFNPRGQSNSDALSDFVVADLRQACPSLAAALESGNIRARKNPTVFTRGGVRGRSIDLVLHESAASPAITVCVSIEHKTIMTAHGKARLNRYGDLIAYSNHMHNHRPECIAGGVVVVNISPAYENPDAFAKGLQRPTFNMSKIVANTVKIFAEIPLRDESSEPSDRPEAIGVIVVDYDGVNPAKLVAGPLAPQPGSAIHYDSFIRRISDLYAKRFSAQ